LFHRPKKLTNLWKRDVIVTPTGFLFEFCEQMLSYKLLAPVFAEVRKFHFLLESSI